MDPNAVDPSSETAALSGLPPLPKGYKALGAPRPALGPKSVAAPPPPLPSGYKATGPILPVGAKMSIHAGPMTYSVQGPPRQSPQERMALEQSGVASKGLDDLLVAGKAVLPQQPGVGALFQRGQRWLHLQEGYPDVTKFKAAQTVLINHLRAIAGVSRVNQMELQMASDAIANAGSYPALEAAVGEAKKRLAEVHQQVSSGGMAAPPQAAPGAQPAPATGGSPASAAPTQPVGEPKNSADALEMGGKPIPNKFYKGKPVLRMPDGKVWVEP